MNIQQKQEVNQRVNQLAQSNKRQFSPVFKGIIVLLLLITFILYRVFLTQPSVDCIYDAYQVATIAANRILVVDQSASSFQGNSNQLSASGKIFIGVGQVLMDLWIAVLGIIWLIKVRNVRGFGSIAVFFLTRSLIFLNIQKFPYPQNIVWRSPGFFGFTVPYDHTRDFFYSGHTGTLATIFLEMAILNLRVAASLSFVSLLFMMNMLLITRVHYVADIVGGLLFAIWYHRQATRAVLYIDKLLSLPFFIFHWIYLNKCKPLCSEDDLTSDNQGKMSQYEKHQQEHRGSAQNYNGALQIENKRSEQHLR